jgi:4-carboxymuconolactone decarboxylase
MQMTLLGLTEAPSTPRTLLESSWRDYLFAEIWTRPGLDRRSRFFITICSAACENARPEVLDGYVRGALKLGDITVVELREAAVQLAVYGGWSRGEAVDMSISRVVEQLGLSVSDFRPFREKPWSARERISEGSASFDTVMTFPAPPPTTAYFGGGIVNFVFAEMWLRPELDQRARRWVTLVGVAYSSAVTPIRTHVYAAFKTGDITLEEAQEFVLQFAIHGGWPKASFLQGVVMEMGDRVQKGLPYQ